MKISVLFIDIYYTFCDIIARTGNVDDVIQVNKQTFDIINIESICDENIINELRKKLCITRIAMVTFSKCIKERTSGILQSMLIRYLNGRKFVLLAKTHLILI